MGGTGEDYLHRAPAPRELLKEPPHLWQLLWPDGENLEHWVGPVEHREERERMKEEEGGGGEAEEGSEHWFHQRGPIRGARTHDNGGASQTRRWGGQKHNQTSATGTKNGVKRGERPKRWRIEVTNVAPESLQLSSLMGDLGN